MSNQIRYFLDKLNLNLKILMPFVLVHGTFVVLMIAVILFLWVKHQELITEISTTQEVNVLTDRIQSINQQIDLSVLSYRFKTDGIYIDTIVKHDSTLDGIIPQLESIPLSTKAESLKNIYITRHNSVFQSRNLLLDAIREGNNIKISNAFDSWQIATSQRDASLLDLQTYHIESLQRSTNLYAAFIDKSVLMFGLMLLIMSVLVVLLLFYLRRVVSNPIHELSSVADEISAGNFVKFKEFNGRDEISQLSRNLNRMSNSLELSYKELQKEVEEKEAALEKSLALEKRKDDFIRMASHELKTPITSIKVFAKLIRKYLNKPPDDPAVVYLSKMGNQIDRISMLVQELLDVSIIQKGHLDLKREHFYLNDTVKDMCDLMQGSTLSKKIVIQENCSVLVYADKLRIEQILINLLENAIRYSPDGYFIRVGLSNENGNIRVYVKDDGEGIRTEDQKYIFERFYRAQNKKNLTYPGMGMGLFISRAIVEAHKGKIWVESSENNGAMFSFVIPSGVNSTIRENTYEKSSNS